MNGLSAYNADMGISWLTLRLFIDVICPRLPRIYSVLYNLLRRHLAAQPTSVNTLKVAVCEDEDGGVLKVSTTAMSGNTICENLFPMTARIGDHVISVLRELELPVRVALDNNLYTHAEFVAHYGKDKGEFRWRDAARLQGCALILVTEGGAILDPSANDALLVTLFPRMFLQPQVLVVQ